MDGKAVTMQAVNNSVNALVPLTIINTRGPEIPRTGDNGVWMYGVIGAAFILASAAVFYLALKKRKVEDK